MLKSLVALLLDRYGFAAVLVELTQQYRGSVVTRHDLLVELSDQAGGTRRKIPRIRLVKKLSGMDLADAKKWVEANYRDHGYGDPR